MWVGWLKKNRDRVFGQKPKYYDLLLATHAVDFVPASWVGCSNLHLLIMAVRLIVFASSKQFLTLSFPRAASSRWNDSLPLFFQADWWALPALPTVSGDWVNDWRWRRCLCYRLSHCWWFLPVISQGSSFKICYPCL